MPAPKVSVIIPALNESATIRTVVDRLLATEVASEILIVDDGSTDGTYETLQKIEAQHPKLVRIFKHSQRSGKGAAIKTALHAIEGDIVAIQDADLEYDPQDLPKLVAPFSDSSTTTVYGSRILGNNPRSNNRFYWGGRLLSFATSLLYHTRITDEPTGYKLIRTETLRSLELESDGFEFCPEVTGKLLRAGHKIIELPISYNPRSFSDGKKIRWHHGLTALSTLLSIRLKPSKNRFSSRVSTFLSVLVLGLFVALAWSNNLHAPFVLDDLGSIRDNQSIKTPFELGKALSPPFAQGETVGGRPLLNLTFAANYAISELDPWSYHFTNICIHFFCALTFFGLVRRSLGLWEQRKGSLAFNRDMAATLAALLWAVHPLVTAAVSYTAQRAESLVALFYLLTLYGAVRSLSSGNKLLWASLSVIACFAGTGVKEIIVTAPIAVMLLDFVFLPEPNFGKQLKQRLPLYLCLFLSWIPLFLLMQSTSGRGGTAGLSFGADSWEYFKTQTWALVHYLRLTFWPDPLVFDYGRNFSVTDPGKWIPRAIAITFLFAASLYGFVKRNPLGLIGLLCFLFLGPTSSFVPIADRVFEHRFYLPLAGICALLVVVVSTFSRRVTLAFVMTVSILGTLVIQARNAIYNDAVTLWQHTITEIPNNARAHNNLATLLVASGDLPEAIAHYEQAIESAPTALLHHNLANSLALAGDTDQAIDEYQAALALDPNLHRARLGLADAYFASGNAGPSIQHFKKFVEANPDQIVARRKLASAYYALGDRKRALEEFEYIATQLPDDAQAQFDLGEALAQNQDIEGAKAALLKAIELDPNNSQAFGNLGNIYLMQKNFTAAASQYQKSIELQPTAMIHTNLAISYLYLKRVLPAKKELENALKLDPNYTPAENLLKRLEGQR